MRIQVARCLAASTLPRALGVLSIASTVLGGQKPPAVRQIGTLERMTPDSVALASIATALPMPGGRAMINDGRGRRVLLFDSTLARAIVVADTTSATASAYGSSWATLIRYRGDTALLMVPSTLSMFVIGPTGAIARVMAMPRPNDAQLLAGSWGVPGVDAHGRLVYFGGRSVLPGITMLGRGMAFLQDGKPTEVARLLEQNSGGMIRVGKQYAESSVVVRVDLDTRAVDTAAWIRIPKFQRELKVDANGLLTSLEITPDPLPLIDQWTVLGDGTLAVVRGRDYHVDWLDASGHLSSSPKMRFDWRRVDDARKQALIDSTVAQWQGEYDRAAAQRLTGASRSGAAGSSGTGGRGGGSAGGRPGGPAELAPTIAVRSAVADLPDYYPPFDEHAASADVDDNLWIRTTTLIDGRPVYDIVNRRGELFDRVQLPRYRTIAGFGPSVVYMAVTDSTGVVRLERARIK